MWISLNLYFFTINSKSFTKLCWCIFKINLVWIYFFLSPLQPLWSIFSLNLTGLLKWPHLGPPSSHDFPLLINVLCKRKTTLKKQTNKQTTLLRDDFHPIHPRGIQFNFSKHIDTCVHLMCTDGAHSPQIWYYYNTVMVPNRLVPTWERSTQGCILSPCLCNSCAEYIRRNAGLEAQHCSHNEAQAAIKIARRNINDLRYADNTTLMAEKEEELKSLLMKVKEESEKAGLKLNIPKLRSWHMVPSLHGN